MYHLATELTNLPQRLLEPVDLEIRERLSVAGSPAPLVNSEGRCVRCRLPTLPLVACSNAEFDAQDSAPETSGASWIVCRELDELQW